MVGQKRKSTRRPPILLHKAHEFTIKEGCLLTGTRVVIPTRYQGQVLAEFAYESPWYGTNEFFSAITCTYGDQLYIKISNRPSKTVLVGKLTVANPL